MDDLLYDLGLWLRETPLQGFARGLAETGLSGWLVEHFWFIPLLQSLHILALTMFFGSVVMLVLRIFGRSHIALTIPETAARFVPWQRGALVLLLLSGLFLIVAEPERELVNPVFWIKMVLISVALLITWAHHRFLVTNSGELVDGAAKGRAILLLLLWCIVILCGRWIAYSPI